MDRIAESAAVSLKTIYRHFENKDELFSAVVQAACRADSSIPAERDDASPASRFTWFEESPKRGLAAAGRDYLRHLLSEEQLALYRVVTRDAHRFPELGRRYEKEVVATSTNIMRNTLPAGLPSRTGELKTRTAPAASSRRCCVQEYSKRCYTGCEFRKRAPSSSTRALRLSSFQSCVCCAGMGRYSQAISPVAGLSLEPEIAAGFPKVISVEGTDRRKLIPLSDCKSVVQASKLKDEKANLGRLLYGNVGSWYHDRLPGLVLDSRDVLEAFTGCRKLILPELGRLGTSDAKTNEPPAKLSRRRRLSKTP